VNAKPASVAARRVFVTGAAGYIGSHTVLALARAGLDVVGFDNYSNCSRLVPQRLAESSPRPISWVEGDVRDRDAVRQALASHRPDCVIHFAGMKSVEESCRHPSVYYDVNVHGTLRLLEAMRMEGVTRLVFSSSATVYDANYPSPMHEGAPIRCLSPYGRSKYMAEQVIADVANADGEMRFAVLRYFNPVGADRSGRIGESPRGQPANLMPAICRAALGRGAPLIVFGSDYPTRDGSGVRDYVHVDDLARAHLRAIDRLETGCQSFIVNVGSGRGYSVLEVLHAFAAITGVEVPFKMVDRRPGDAAEVYADTRLAVELLDSHAEHDLQRMCEDAWRWQQSNRDGYE